LVSLTLLDIRDSKLTGTIPTELGQLTSLTDLWVNANQLTGTNPKELGRLVSIEVLEKPTGDNSLIGTIQTEICQLLLVLVWHCS
jgi:Leucine-rich repeat (LRR) protein